MVIDEWEMRTLRWPRRKEQDSFEECTVFSQCNSANFQISVLYQKHK